MKKTILITWWLWYIWSHAVVAFEQAWYNTIIVDNLVNSDIDVLNSIEKIIWYKPIFFQTDLRDKVKLESLFKEYSFDWVIHFAWLKAVWESCEKPLEYFDNNIIWSIRLFELIDKFKVKNIIFSSSATVYKETNTNIFKEDDLTWDCTNPYWTTKFILEQILRDLSIHAWFNVINLRYFNPIWAHKSWLLWEEPNWLPNNLLPYIMKVARWDLPYLRVFWDDYDTVDWTWIRDYIDVNDLIEWHLLAYEKLNKLNSNWFFEIYNLWTGKGVSVFEMLKTAEIVIWKEIAYKIYPRRNWDLAEVYCDTEKAKEELLFVTKIGLEESLENSWRFYNK